MTDEHVDLTRKEPQGGEIRRIDLVGRQVVHRPDTLNLERACQSQEADQPPNAAQARAPIESPQVLGPVDVNGIDRRGVLTKPVVIELEFAAVLDTVLCERAIQKSEVWVLRLIVDIRPTGDV